MRILLATDGTTSSEQAWALVARVDWPAGTAIRIVHVIDSGIGAYLALSGAPVSTETYEELAGSDDEYYGTALRAMVDRLARPGLIVDSAVVHGRPASQILGAAEAFKADLVVVGSHGRGSIGSFLLGSVAAEVVEYGTRPVLIARESTIERLLLADDGSSAAAIARSLVGHMPGFKGKAVRVISVARRRLGWVTWLGTEAAGEVQAIVEADEAERHGHLAVADGAAAELRAAGLAADSASPTGDPGTEIVRAAQDMNADLIVMGTRGQTGLERLLLGSVARKVLQHARTSVLVVPAGRAGQQPDHR
jgi:nucleotide-binding universal stress UspA family protein